MKTIIRTCLILVSFALSSALSAGTINFSASNGTSVQIYLQGTSDGNLQLVNTDTNQVVLNASYLTTHNGWGDAYIVYWDSGVAGVSLSQGWNQSSIDGLPQGNYALTVSSSRFQDFSVWDDGSYFEIQQYNPDWSTDWMYWSILVQYP